MCLNRNAIFVSITRANRGEIPDIDNGTTLEDRSCGYWHVNVPKVNQCELLIAVDGGTIVKVWGIDRDFGWRPMERGALPTQHKGRRINEIDGMARMRGPVRYNF